MDRFSPENRCMRSIMGLVPSVISAASNNWDIDKQVEELMFWKDDLPNAENLKVPKYLVLLLYVCLFIM